MELYELSVAEAGKLLRRRETTPAELAGAAFERIGKIDGRVNAFLSLCEELAFKQAQTAGGMLGGESASPLAGIPMGIKDNICTRGVPTTCASKMLEDFTPPYDATVYEKLGAAGAVMAGKLNLDEFAMGGSTETSYFKKPPTPCPPGRAPAGPPGGAAAAAAAGEVFYALGSDTGGSIRQPSAFCGAVGLKPPYGAVSRYGLVAFASSLDQIGPIARNVADCATVLNAIVGVDPRDSTSAAHDHPDYTSLLGREVKGMKIGLPREYFGSGLSPAVREAVLGAAKQFEALGARCEEAALPAADYAIPAYYLISSAEASSNLARYDGIKFGYAAKDCDNLAQLMDRSRGEGFGREVKRRIMLGTYALSAGYYDAYYKKALQVRRLIKNGFDALFEKFDLILGPTAPTTAYPLGSKSGDPLAMYLGDAYTVPVNIAGIPALSLNCGFDADGMPIGLQLIGPAFSEAKLLQAAYAFENSTPFNRRPDL